MMPKISMRVDMKNIPETSQPPFVGNMEEVLGKGKKEEKCEYRKNEFPASLLTSFSVDNMFQKSTHDKNFKVMKF